MTQKNLPIGVDLDGTLVKTNTIIESTLLLIKTNPLTLLWLPAWLMRGKAYFKNEVVRRTSLPVADLPYNPALLQYLREQREAGHELYLATAAPTKIAHAVAQHLSIFSGVFATDAKNLAGPAKAAALVERFGTKGYIYAGNSLVDIPVWQQAAAGIVVNGGPRVERAAASVTKVLLVVPPTPVTWRTLIRLLRCHQWVKNVLVWVPVIAAHALGLTTWWIALWAFVAFCLTSSSVYVLNDLLDMTHDRRHPTKRRRPLAAGEVPIPVAVALFFLLLIMGVGLGWAVAPSFLGWLLVYVALTTLYSFYLKRLVVIDVVVLGLLYTLRIFAGAAAVAVVVSTWLFVFSLFLFMSLALLKRFTELLRSPNKAGASLAGRGYQGSDMAPIGGLGMASGYISVLVLGLYISSSEVTLLYREPYILWGLMPLLLYWMSRLWVLAYRGSVPDDPVVFAMQDQVSYIILGMSLLIVWLAT